MSAPATFASFEKIWHIDFEYRHNDDAGWPEPVCYCMHEHRSGERIAVWLDGVANPPCPPIGPNDLLVSFSAPAELGCYLALGWKMPPNVLDLYVEAMLLRNSSSRGVELKEVSLLDTLTRFGVAHITAVEKQEMRDLILHGAPYSPEEQKAILTYCWTDVDATVALLPLMVRRLVKEPHWLLFALNRGRYMRGVAAMNHTGVPLDMHNINRLRTNWDVVTAELKREVEKEFPVFGDRGISAKLFDKWIEAKGIYWPRTPTGLPKIDSETLEDQVKVMPELRPIFDVSTMLGRMKGFKVFIGPDGRNRSNVWPFTAKTGRNRPTGSVFASAVWLRGMIKPGPGRAVANIDYKAQEILIAAALSGDQALLAAYETGDPYLHFADMAGLMPADADVDTRKSVRALCKVLMLGVSYGMGPALLAQRASIELKANTSLHRARLLLLKHHEIFHVFWDWCVRRDHATTRA